MSLTPTFIKTHGMTLSLRDITQAYTHSETILDRLVLIKLFVELKNKYPEGIIIRVIRPLYRITKSGVYWWIIYQNHYRNFLDIIISSFDPCLLITDQAGEDGFGIVGI
jgi:predicted transcriptional regulator